MKASEIGQVVVDRLDGDYDLTFVRHDDGGAVYKVDDLAGVLVWVSEHQTGVLVSDNDGDTWL